VDLHHLRHRDRLLSIRVNWLDLLVVVVSVAVAEDARALRKQRRGDVRRRTLARQARRGAADPGKQGRSKLVS
jgi:hypothetical protein